MNIHWEAGTAYDFFISLFVLNHAADFGLRPSWAAGVRQRLPSTSREFLEQFGTFIPVPLDWIHALPEPRDAATALRSAANLTPRNRLEELCLPFDTRPDVRNVLSDVAARHTWTPAERVFLENSFHKRGKDLKPDILETQLKAWSSTDESGELLLTALNEYFQVFFAEEEKRIRPAIEEGLKHARELAGHLTVNNLVEELSRGVQFAEINTVKELTLAPSYWSTPLIFHTGVREGNALIVFGCRPEAQSVAPGAEAPDSLVNALKSLADPTRLRILRYLAGEPLTPTELSRRLRLRPPTVIHHLRGLRLSGLVSVTVSENGERCYTARLETVRTIFTNLQSFFKKQD